ncbi:MAG: hypothetical protein GY870_00700 [archaeon]|nr:hypothetical protein [archaeon]
MFDDLTEEDKELYLDVLREGATPFDRFVSRGDIEDLIDIPNSRKLIDRTIYRAISQTQLDQSTRLIPILGEAGAGKTHAYWAYKDKERKMKDAEISSDIDADYSGPVAWSIVYVPSPPAAIRILLHVYSCMIDSMGADILGTVAEKLVNRWGGKKKKHLGLFGTADLDEIIQNGIREYPGVFADCVKCLVIFEMDKDRRSLAERWLLGEDLDEEELDKLGINSVIEEDDICLAMIKIISEHTDETIILYFDELESPYRMHGEEAERKFLEVLKRLYNEVKNLVIIIAVLKEIWPRILEIADMPLRSRMEPERELAKWSLDDLKLYFAKSMVSFWANNNLNPPTYPLFPLNDQVLSAIYNKTDGNQRSIIKLIRIFIEKITYGDMTLEELIQDEQIVPTAQPSQQLAKSEIDEEIMRMAQAAQTKATQAKSNLAAQIEQMMQEEDFIIDVNPASVAGASLKCIKIIGDKNNKEYAVDLEFQFLIGKRNVTLAGLITYEGRKIALEIPAVKTFDRSGGVSAFYAAKRLMNAIEKQAITDAILIVPINTKGQKYQSILKQNPTINVIEIDNEQGESLLRGAGSQNPSEIGIKIANIVFSDVVVPIPSDEETTEESQNIESESPSEEVSHSEGESTSESNPPSGEDNNPLE